MEDGKVIALTTLGAVILVVGLIFGVRLLSIADTKYLGAAEENAKTEAFENTKAYRDGVKHDMDDLCLSYAKAQTDDERKAIASIARHRMESVPQELVPACVKEIVR